MAILKENLRRNYNYESPKSHPPNPPSCSGLRQDNVPLWEKGFCASVGIPWEKVLHTKRYLHHADVLKWNDSAGEEAFLNAKHRFWEEINGIPCSIFLPDPDVYNDDIDWNESMNSDRINSQVSSYATEGHYRKPDSDDCPWEYRNMQGVLKGEEAGVWNQWVGNINESRNLNCDDDCLKHTCTWTSGAVRDDSGEHCGEL